MKKLFNFEVLKDEEVEEQIESKNEAGETVITKKKEIKKVSHKFFLAKPTRTLSDQASLFTSVRVGEGLKAGLCSIYTIDKRYREEGVFTEEDNNKYKELYDNLFLYTEELQKIAIISETERTEDQKNRQTELNGKITDIRLQLKEFESIKSNLYTHSAEYRARNLTLTWWVLHLSYKEDGGKELEFFPGKTLDDRLNVYDSLVEKNDPFINDVLERFLYATSFWFLNGAEKAEDFNELEKLIQEERSKTTQTISG